MDNRKFWLIAVICILAAFVYFAFPIDVIPDLVAGIGWLDDLVVALCGLAGLLVNVFWALGILPAPGMNRAYEQNMYEEYGEYREI